MKYNILLLCLCFCASICAQGDLTQVSPMLQLEQLSYAHGEEQIPLKHTNSYHLRIDPADLPSLTRKFRHIPYWQFFINFGDGTFARVDNQVDIVHTYKTPGTYTIKVQATPVYTDDDDSIDEERVVNIGDVLTSSQPNELWLINNCIDLTNERDGVPGETVIFIVGYKNSCFDTNVDAMVKLEFNDDEFEFGEEDIEQNIHEGDYLLNNNVSFSDGFNKHTLTYKVSDLAPDEQRNFFIKLRVKDSVLAGERLKVDSEIIFSTAPNESCSTCNSLASQSLKIGDSHDPSFKIMKLEQLENDDTEAYKLSVRIFCINDGTAPTDSIRIEDHYRSDIIIDSVVWNPPSTIRTHREGLMDIDFTNNKINFLFNPIYLRGIQEPSMYRIFTPDQAYDGIEYEVYFHFPDGSTPDDDMICSTINVFFDQHPPEVVRACAFLHHDNDVYHNYKGKTVDMLDSLLVLKPEQTWSLAPNINNLSFEPTDYFWHPTGTIGTTLSINPDTTTEYIFIAASIDDFGQVLEYAADRILVEVKHSIDPADIVVHVDAVSCVYGNDGRIKLQYPNADEETSYSIKWNNSESSSPTRTGLLRGRYEATVTNTIGADTVLSIIVPEPLSLYVSDDISGGSDLSPFISGGFPPYTVVWDDGSTGFTYHNPEPARCYGLTVTDANGCQYAGTVQKIYCVPALSEWLFILIILLFLTYGIIVLLQSNGALASSPAKYSPFLGNIPLDQHIYIQTAQQFFYLPLLFVVGVLCFYTKLSIVDIGGILLTNGIIVYWLHLLKLLKQSSRTTE